MILHPKFSPHMVLHVLETPGYFFGIKAMKVTDKEQMLIQKGNPLKQGECKAATIH